MELLIDLFGYLSIIVHGLTILAQSMALGGVLFLVLLVATAACVAAITVLMQQSRDLSGSRAKSGRHRNMQTHADPNF